LDDLASAACRTALHEAVLQAQGAAAAPDGGRRRELEEATMTAEELGMLMCYARDKGLITGMPDQMMFSHFMTQNQAGGAEVSVANLAENLDQLIGEDGDEPEYDPADQQYLNASLLDCPAKCHTYHDGASAKDPMVCQRQASGIGNVVENTRSGVACFPAYGCPEDWATCVPHSRQEARRRLEVEPELTTDEDICEAVATLEMDGDLGHAGGWLKRQGMIVTGSNCDGNLHTWTHMYDMTVVSTHIRQYWCCMQAMSFEGNSDQKGGPALRFQADGTKCRIDTEQWLRTGCSDRLPVSRPSTRPGRGSQAVPVVQLALCSSGRPSVRLLVPT
jgi:hypothetical protein